MVALLAYTSRVGFYIDITVRKISGVVKVTERELTLPDLELRKLWKNLIRYS